MKYKLNDIVIVKNIEAYIGQDYFKHLIDKKARIIIVNDSVERNTYPYTIQFFESNLESTYEVKIKNKIIRNCIEVFEDEIELYNPVLKTFLREKNK